MSCSSPEDQYVDVLNKLNIDDFESQIIFIIPGAGCPGCISNAEQLLIDFVDKDYPIIFVLTNFTSFKALKIKLGEAVILSDKVRLDHNRILHRNKLINIYPIALIYSQNRLEKIIEFKPDNPDATSQLLQYVQLVTVNN